MKLIDLTEYKNKLNEYNKELNELKDTLKINEKENELNKLEKKTLEENFWNNEKESSNILTKIKQNKGIVEEYNKIVNKYNECDTIINMLKEEMDADLIKELSEEFEKLAMDLDNIKTKALLSKQYDSSNAIVTIHPGAGGTESQDWASMLYRMYIRWAERTKHDIEVYDIQDGDEAGIKSVTFSVKGEYPYGYLKGEKGVHRLVRISPFDSNSRRHTSFAAVDVVPEIDDNITLDIKDEDLEIGTFRASGAGGQHINKTDSAVRIKHVPTGIVVTCQTERSQFQNKDNAMKMLKAKIYQLELQKNKDKINEIKGENTENGWGNQIRSYVFCPYTLVKDHRTDYEIGNVQKVMDGYIDEFIAEYLRSIKE